MNNSIRKLQALLLALMAGALFANTCKAAQIQGVTIASFSSQYTNGSEVFPSGSLVSGVGLFGDAHGNFPGGSMWLAGTNGLPGTNFVTFNLGGVYTVNAMKVWNYNDSSRLDRGVSNASISYSMDGVNFTTNIPLQNFNKGPGTVSAFGQTIQMPAPVTAQYIRIDVITNWGLATTNGVGLAEVRFISNTNAPTVLSATENYGSNQVTVFFSEPVDTSSATSPANYSVTSSGSTVISNITTGEYGDRVILHTSPLTNSSYSVVVSGVYDEALTATVTNNSTVPVQSELFLWLMANKGVSTTTSNGVQNVVTGWTDQSPSGHNAIPSTLLTYTNGPILSNNIINGLPALAFYGSNALQVLNDPTSMFNGDMTLFMVVAKTSINAYGEPIAKNGGNLPNAQPGPWDFYFSKNGTLAGSPTFGWGNGFGNGQNNLASGALPTNTFYVIALRVVATNTGTIFTNGMQAVASKVFNGAPQDSGNPIEIGTREDGLNFSGYLAETMLIRGTITSNDFTSIDSYLAGKYNIAATTISEQPASLTAQVNNQATFWVNASGLPPLKYQWQSNGVAIPGATNLFYTTPYLTSSANDANYTVTVTGASGNVANSTAAILTVVADTTPPTVFSATRTAGLTNVVVMFSEPVSSGTALNAANYSINGGISVLSAAAGNSPNQVVLTTSTLNSSGLYSLAVQNVQDLSGNALISSHEPLMPSTMTMWLRGDSGIVTNASASVPSQIDEWLDQTTNGNNAVTYTVGPASRPSLGGDPVDGAPTMVFNSGAQNYLTVASSPGTALLGDMTIYAVVNFSDYTLYREILGKATGGQPNPYDYNATTGGSGTLRFLRGNGSASGIAGSTLAATVNQPQVIGVTMQGTSVNHYLNGNPNGNGTISATITDNGAPLYIGTRSALDVFMNGDISELMMFSNSISGSDRTNIDNYLGAKYFPFTVTEAPSDLTTNDGTTATFSVVCSQGSAHLAYQWIENSTNISGATSSSYTTGILLPGDNGDTFSVAVSVPGVSTNLLGPATLTVNSVPPTVLSVGETIWNTNGILVIFSEAVNASTALNVANYSLNNGATVISASFRAANEVLLTTSPLAQGTSYSVNVQNVTDDFGVTMAATNVTSAIYPPNLALWLRADEGISATDGVVSEWDDQSTNGNNFTAGYAPTLVTNAINGWPAVQFDGTNETYMSAPSSTSLAITGDMTIFAVMEFTTYLPNGATGGGEIISKTDGAPFPSYPASYDYYVYYGGANTVFFLRGDGQSGSDTFEGSINSPSLGVPHELSAMMQGTTIYHRLDGNTNGTLPWAGTIGDTGQSVFIGTRGDGNVRLTGEMAELIMFGSALSSNDVTSIENYLGAKYGLISAPVLNVAQSNGNVVVSWNTPRWSYNLQSTPSLSAPVWSTVTNLPVVANGSTSVTVPVSAGQMFYRLQSQ